MDDCPHPHMDKDEAEAWWMEYFNAKDEATRRLIDNKARPAVSRGRPRPVFIAGTAGIEHA